MNAADRRNAALAALFAALALLCGGLFASSFLWKLVDVENHLQARLTFAASVMMYLVGAFSLDAFAAVLRFGFIPEKSLGGTVCAIAHALLRSLLTFCNAGLLFLGAVAIVDAGAEIGECLGALLFLAVLLCGYGFLFRLEKRLKAQRAPQNQ